MRTSRGAALALAWTAIAAGQALEPPDAIFHSGTMITANGTQVAEAFTVPGSRFAAVGTSVGIRVVSTATRSRARRTIRSSTFITTARQTEIGPSACGRPSLGRRDRSPQ